MITTLVRGAFLTFTMTACPLAIASWLDEAHPASWNKPGLVIPTAPKIQGSFDPRCRDLARPPELEADKRLQDQGWDLVGAFQGGWQILVIRATAGYDGMCRPRQYQDFVFVRGVFTGTLSPQPMDSRADGALGGVVLQNRDQLIAEYERYGAKDPLCCPSGATSVVFEIASDTSVLKPVSASNSRGTRVAASPPPPAANAADSQAIEGKYWQAIELSGRSLQQGTRKPYLQFQPGGRVSGSDGCNQITGHYELKGDRLTFGQMASTQMACVNGPDTERPFREALKSTTRLTASGDRLELFDSTGNSLAAFRAGSQGSEPAASPGLAGTSWRLVEFQGSDDTKLTPDDPAKYTIHFDAGGQLAARIDCNRGRGAWNSSGPDQIELGPLALTRAKCPPGSLHDQIVKQWGNVRSYVIKDGHLFLALMADGGVLEFEPLSQTK